MNNEKIINISMEVEEARKGQQTVGERLDNFDRQLEDITDKTTKLNMISEDGTSWVLYIDNYGQIGVIKEV